MQRNAEETPRVPSQEAALTGLTQADVQQRRAAGQGNDASVQTGRTYWQILTQNTFTFINTIFFVIGAFMIFLGLWSDAIISVGIVLMNVVIGIWQEFRAKAKLDQIALLTRPKATVIREGQEGVIDPSEIVIGDLIVADAGDQIVVDGVVVGKGSAEVDESLLTGESDLVPKHQGDELLSGSFCVTGKLLYEAQRVGVESYAHKLTAQARQFSLNKTPLQRDTDFVIRLLALVAAFLGLLFGASFILRDVSAEENVRTAAVIVGLVPNGLFFMIVTAYAMGALRMSGRGALIQQSNSIESMSNVDVLCLDKTGTLTANRINLRTLHPLNAIDEARLRQLLGTFAASASTGNRTSQAVAEAVPGEALRVVDEVAFSSARKWSALALDAEPVRGVYALGAPEMLAPYLDPVADDGAVLAAQFADEGLRVLLFAGSEGTLKLHDSLGQPGLPQGMRPLAILTFQDELRPETKETLAQFAAAGIRVKVISGDNPHTVAALARQAGLEGDLQVLSGTKLDAIDDAQLAGVVENVSVFGRIRPDQKERLVEALRSRGYYVAMIGDGVNDVMSLKKAQIGIAMQSGSQATRGVADIVLMGDSFAALPAAFIEGQRILSGMQDIVRLFLTRVFYVALLIFGTAVVADASFFPFVPVHGGLLTLLTVGIPTFFLAVWARPSVQRERLVSSMVHFVLPASITMALLGLVVYVFYLLQLPPLPERVPTENLSQWLEGQLLVPRTALLTTLMFAGLLLIPFVEPPTKFWVAGDQFSGDWRPTVLAVLMLIVYLVILLVDPLRNFFQIARLPLTDYLLIAASVVVWAVLLRWIWRANVFDRFLGLELKQYTDQ